LAGLAIFSRAHSFVRGVDGSERRRNPDREGRCEVAHLSENRVNLGAQRQQPPRQRLEVRFRRI
jgi:hypothetical protein